MLSANNPLELVRADPALVRLIWKSGRPTEMPAIDSKA